MSVQLVWFKRDLRVHDHAPLLEASRRGAVLPLYIIEPEMIGADDYDPAHYTFIRASLAELRANLAQLGQPLIVRYGNAVQVIQSFHQQVNIEHIWAHEETGNWISFQRDLAVHAWAKTHGIPFTEIPQNGVIRRLRSRDLWEKKHNQWFEKPLAQSVESLPSLAIAEGRLPMHKQVGLGRDTRPDAQAGGETAGVAILNDFLRARGDRYFGGLATPAKAWDDSSRLSPHLTWGTLSLKRVVQGVWRRIRQVEQSPVLTEYERGAWLRALRGFESRLHWRDHYIQKLESEPELEFRPYLSCMDGIRGWNNAFFEAWCAGETGYPLVDAAMRAVAQTGWLNFRLRAMVVSFASYDLWLDWRKPSVYLATCFVDYEPGIHYTQWQAQAGMTGINTLRVYDPIKQAKERDKAGEFVRKWVPELTTVPDLFIHEPWRMPPSVQREANCVIGTDYARPIVDHALATKKSKGLVHAARSTSEAKSEAREVYLKHGSRSWREMRDVREGKVEYNAQMSLFGDG